MPDAESRRPYKGTRTGRARKTEGSVICSLELPLTLIIFTDCMAGRVRASTLAVTTMLFLYRYLSALLRLPRPLQIAVY